MKNSRFLGLIGLLLFVIALNLFVLYLPELLVPGPRLRSSQGKPESGEDAFGKIRDIEERIGDGFSSVFGAEGTVEKTREARANPESTVQPSRPRGNTSISAGSKRKSDSGPASVPGKHGSPSTTDSKPGSPGGGRRLGEWLISEPESYTLVEPSVILAGRSLWEGRKVRFRCRFLQLQRDFETVRALSGVRIARETHIRMLVVHEDCAWNFLPSSNGPLILKAGFLERGDGIQVFGRVLATEAGYILLVDDIAGVP